jgi:hypothetical protein
LYIETLEAVLKISATSEKWKKRTQFYPSDTGKPPFPVSRILPGNRVRRIFKTASYIVFKIKIVA